MCSISSHGHLSMATPCVAPSFREDSGAVRTPGLPVSRGGYLAAELPPMGRGGGERDTPAVLRLEAQLKSKCVSVPRSATPAKRVNCVVRIRLDISDPLCIASGELDEQRPCQIHDRFVAFDQTFGKIPGGRQ